MGSRSSKHHKATSPYGSWGQSFDDLLCGPGQICADDWTPLPSRAHSLSPSRLRRRSLAVSPGGAEVYTLRRNSVGDVYDEQPMPVEAHLARSPYHLASARSRRRSSYRPGTRSASRRSARSISRRPNTPWQKTKKKRVMKRTETYPVMQRPVTVDLEPVLYRRRARSHSRRKKPSSLDNRPPWRDIISARHYEEYLNPSIIPVNTRRSRSKHKSPVALDSHIPPLRLPKAKVSGPASAATYTVSNSSGSNSRKVVPPRDKVGADPPPAFRVKGLPDQKYRRIPTMATIKR